MAQLTAVEQLRKHYREPSQRSANKAITHLDAHSRQFISLANFVVLSTQDQDGFADLSPRGGVPGFVAIVDDHTLLIPDSKGNNRLDTLTNLLRNPSVGLMFMAQGIDETLRIKGVASLHDRADFSALLGDDKVLDVVMKIEIRSLFFHCGKAAMRADLWDGAFRVDRSTFPSIAKIMKDQQKLEGDAMTQTEIVQYYKETL